MRIINSELTYNQAVLESLIELTKNTPTKYFDPTIVLSEVYRRGYILEIEVILKAGIKKSLDYLADEGLVLRKEMTKKSRGLQEGTFVYRADLSKWRKLSEYLSKGDKNESCNNH
ncbi:hypothetical protein J4221_00010 [Candidatus Pacearchaeota archaeon]|nr:hypothetical protein [Candidatus Pacearchaeota archaeon]